MDKLKNVLYALLAVMLTMTVTSCSKDDEPSSGGSMSIEGTWLVTEEVEGDGYFDDGADYYFSFGSGNSFRVACKYHGDSETLYIGTYKLSGNKLVLRDSKYSDGDRIFEGTVTVSGNNMTYAFKMYEEYYPENYDCYILKLVKN